MNATKDELFDRTKRDLRSLETQSRPLAEILREMIAHLGEILHCEMRLTFLKVQDEVVARKRALISLVIAHLLIAYGGALLLIGLVYALSTVWPPWLAALSVGAATGLIGLLVLRAAARRLVKPQSDLLSKFQEGVPHGSRAG